jgi:hypothetical protein
MRTLVQEPLAHFLLLGALLFAGYGWLDRGAPGAPDEIVIDAGRIASLDAQFERLWRRAPTEPERAGLIDAFVREEILYREGVALGLDRDDPVIRRRVGQKMDFLAGGLAPQAASDAELQAWLDAHARDYQSDARLDLEQAFFDPQRHGDALDGALARARAALERGEIRVDAAGDRTLLPAALEHATTAEIERQFGGEFAEAVTRIPVGTWQGPVRSGFGVHLVRVTARQEARPAALADVRADVERDLLHARAQEVDAAFYRKLRQRYTVRVEAGAPRAGSVDTAAAPPP